MKSNEKVRDQIFEIIENQLSENNPPETKFTYDRLRELGFDDFETKKYIGQCIAVELFDILKYSRPFNTERYIKNLQELPKEPSL